MGSTQGEMNETIPATKAPKSDTDSFMGGAFLLPNDYEDPGRAGCQGSSRPGQPLQHQVIASLAHGLGQVVPLALDAHAYHVGREVVVGSTGFARRQQPGPHPVDVGRDPEVLELADASRGEAARDGDLHVAAVLERELPVVALE